MTPDPIQLTRDPHGRLRLTTADGCVHEGVVPVRAFPIAAPTEGIALVGTDGHELAWIDRLDNLPEATRTLIEDELASREFMPEIRRLRHVSTFALVCRRRRRSCPPTPGAVSAASRTHHLLVVASPSDVSSAREAVTSPRRVLAARPVRGRPS